MRKPLFFFLFFFFPLSLFAAVEGTYHHYFALEGDFVLLRRANSAHKSLVVAAGGPISPDITPDPHCAKEPGKKMIGSNKLVNDMHFDPGLSVALKIFYGLRSTWEMRYTGLFNWMGKKKISCVQNLRIPGPFANQTIDYNYADHAKTEYRSDFYNAELNYWRHVTPRHTDFFSFSWIAGLRFFNIDEKLKLYFTRVTSTSRYRVRTNSRAFGPQIGFNLEYNPYRFLTWGLTMKGGGLFDRGKQKTLMLDNNNSTVLKDHDPSGSNFAYFFQMYPFFEFRPVKFFSFFLNYQALYIGGVVVADKQIIFHDSGDDLNNGGHIIYHGLTFGMQFNF